MASVPSSSRAARAEARAAITAPADRLSKIEPILLAVPPNLEPDPCDDAYFTHLFHIVPISINNESAEARKIIRDFLEKYYDDEGQNPPQCNCIEIDGRKCFPAVCANLLNKRSCPVACGPSCQNQGFNGLVPVTDVSLSGNELYNRCLIAEKLIMTSKVLFEIVGRVVVGSPSPGQRRAFPIEDRGMEKDLYIDCERTGNISAFLNNSEKPNTEIESWIVGKTIRLFLRAIKPIKPGSVITVNLPHMERKFRQGYSDAVLAVIDATQRPHTSPLPGRNTYRLSPDIMISRADERTSPPLPSGFITCADGHCDCGKVVVCARDQNPAITAMGVQQQDNYREYMIRKQKQEKEEEEKRKQKGKGKGKRKST